MKTKLETSKMFASSRYMAERCERDYRMAYLAGLQDGFDAVMDSDKRNSIGDFLSDSKAVKDWVDGKC